MNNLRKSLLLTSLVALVLCSAFAVRAQVQATSGKDEFFVIDRDMRRLRRALLPHHLHEFRALLEQNALHTADGIALAVQ